MVNSKIQRANSRIQGHHRERLLWVLFVLPYLAVWFTLGSYERRHGLHVILISVMLTNYLLLVRVGQHGEVKSHGEKFLPYYPVFGLLILVCGILVSYSQHADRLRDGGRATFIAQFGPDASIFDDIVARQAPIFAASNYQYGIFFGRASVFRPPLEDPAASNVQRAKEQLIQSKSEYTFTSGEWAYGPYSGNIEMLAKICPDGLSLILKSPVNPHLSIYRVDAQRLARCAI